MKKIPHTIKILGISTLLAILVFFVYILLFSTIKEKSEKASVLSNEANIDLKKDESLRETKASLSSNKEAIEKIDSYFISPDGVVGFIEKLESLGREAGVSVSVASVAVEADSKSKTDFKETLRVRLSTTASWSSTFYFLSLLENLPLRSEIKSAGITLAESSEKLAFTDSTDSDTNVQTSGTWKGEFELTVKKLK